MQQTTVHLHTAHRIGAVDSRLFGGFLEHMGRAVYQGVYQPESSHADAEGWRRDVLDALAGLDLSVVRYPGGNFASGYHWEDGVGPRETRPTVRELAWQSIEPNQVGTDEFVALCRRMNWQPMLTVNLGTGTPEEARNWVEYCNAPAGTLHADRRVANGARAPHGVSLWCLGNEMDGPWQLGHVPAEQYAIRAQQAAKMMKDVDKGIELVVCGSCTPLLPTYLEWDRQVLEHVADLADYISLHRYVGWPQEETLDFLAVTNSIDRQIEQIDAVCRYTAGRRRSRRRPWLCFDEWNVWYKTFAKPELMDGGGRFAPPLIEEVYNLEDALVVAGFLLSFLRHADVLKIANWAQIVNVIAPLLTRGDELLIQSIYWPFAMVSKRREGVSLRVAVEGPSYESTHHGSAAHVDAAAVLASDRLHVFLTNRSESRGEVSLRLADRGFASLESAELLAASDPRAANDWDAPNRVRAVPFDAVQVNEAGAVAILPPLSFVAATMRLV